MGEREKKGFAAFFSYWASHSNENELNTFFRSPSHPVVADVVFIVQLIVFDFVTFYTLKKICKYCVCARAI